MAYTVLHSPSQVTIDGTASIAPETAYVSWFGSVGTMPLDFVGVGTNTPTATSVGTYNGVLNTNQQLVFPLGGMWVGTFASFKTHIEAVAAAVPLSSPAGYNVSFPSGGADIMAGGLCACFPTTPLFTYTETTGGLVDTGVPGSCDGGICGAGGAGSRAGEVYTNSAASRSLLSPQLPPAITIVYLNDITRIVIQVFGGIEFPPQTYDSISPGISGPDLRAALGLQSIESGAGEYISASVAFTELELDVDVVPQGLIFSIITAETPAPPPNVGYQIVLFQAPFVPPVVEITTPEGPELIGFPGADPVEPLPPAEELEDLLDSLDEYILPKLQGFYGDGNRAFFLPFDIIPLPAFAYRLQRTDVTEVMNIGTQIIEALLSSVAGEAVAGGYDPIALTMDLNGFSLTNLAAISVAPEEIRRKA